MRGHPGFLFSLLAVGVAMPQIEKLAPEGRLLVAGGEDPDCTSTLRKSLPECQPQVYGAQLSSGGSPGSIWGELEVSLNVSSPVLFLSIPKDRIKKRKQNKDRKNK